MPAVSGKQYRAMAAAKGGHSTLGIPRSVGAEFVRATPEKKRKAYMKLGGLHSRGTSKCR